MPPNAYLLVIRCLFSSRQNPKACRINLQTTYQSTLLKQKTLLTIIYVMYILFLWMKKCGLYPGNSKYNSNSGRRVMSVRSDSELQAPTHTYKFNKKAESILFMINYMNVLSSSKFTHFLQATSQLNPISSSLSRFYVPSFKLSLLVGT